MKLRTASVWVFWGMSLLPLNAPAQELSPRFRHLTIDDGLSQNAVYALLQDRQGFVWIGTKDGLNQYDGYGFTIYKNVPSDTNSLSNNYVTALFEDSRGYLWVGTLEGGLNRLDRASGHFRRYSQSPEIPGSISSDRITAITEDSSSALWIGTSNGLNRLTAGQAERPEPIFEKFSHDPENQKTSHIPIILLTARAAAEDKLLGLQAGADDYLTKPFQSDELLARVHNLISVRRKLLASLDKKAVLSPSELAVTPVDQTFLENVRQVIEREMGDETFGVETLCTEIAMSERQFRRKLKALTGQTPNQVIRSMRLQRARQLLAQNTATIAEISFLVGFGSPAYFTKSFREEFGVLPSEVGLEMNVRS